MNWIRKNRKYILSYFLSFAIIGIAIVWRDTQSVRGYFAVGGEAFLPLIAGIVFWWLWEVTK